MSFLDRLFLQQQVTISAEAQPLQVVVYGGFSNGSPFAAWSIEVAGLATADVVCIDTTTEPGMLFLKLIGMDPNGLVKQRKLLVNMGPDPIAITNLAGNPAQSSFVLADDGYDLRPNAAVEVLWLPEMSGAPAGWRLVGVGITGL